MSPEPVGARDLYDGLLGHTGPEAYTAVVEPWLARARAAGLRSGPLPRAAGPGHEHRPGGLWELYALSRVSDVLLFSFQPPGHDPWAGPGLTREQYLGLFTGLGMVPFEEPSVFDPFLHEIVEVEQAADPDAAIVVTDVLWPGLWLGDILFCRAGVRVRAGARHAERGVADRSPLYWAFRRRHRPTVDLSMGWGSNSQWRTDFRVDVRTEAGDRLNVMGDTDVDGVNAVNCANADGCEALLTSAERRELLRHRCLLRAPERAGPLATSPGWAADLFPFDWRLRM
ncbi:hypothetical protein ACIRU3_39855 [Streptomyces sp. NPDC101151]|uniref:hypothetical protein n=1 Tax=Streptomyces sp. NPDC101151 TaxID=3366115 RepID=UPI0038174216